MTSLSDKTNVPIGWVIAIVVGIGVSVPSLVGAVMWATTVAMTAAEAKSDVNGLRPILRDIDDRLIRLEVHIKRSQDN